MSKSGNTKGFKVFSINTTVRNPCRDIRFLDAFSEFNGLDFELIWKRYYKKIISLGIYKPRKMPAELQNKINDGSELTEEDVDLIIQKNATNKLNEKGRVGTQLRELKDQGFLKILPDSKTIKNAYVTNLGSELLDSNNNPEDVYCKAMIGLHANNPSRRSMFNKSRPFLNTLYTINGVTDVWKQSGHSELGITDYEFGAFILPMKGCDYQKTICRIIDFRTCNGFIKKDKDYRKLLRLVKRVFNPKNISVKTEKDIKSGIKLIHREYPDEVFRKFKMTNLLEEKNERGQIFYYFNEDNLAKVKSIFESGIVPEFKTFKTTDQYNNFLSKIALPWQKDKKTRIKIAIETAKQFGLYGKGIFTEKIISSNIKTIEDKLNAISSKKGFERAINSSSVDKMMNELEILSGLSNSKSNYENVDEPLRLEFVIAALFALKYGKDKVTSNAKYDRSGAPLYHAPGGKPDIVFRDVNLSFIMEPTMLSSQTEIMKRESVSVWDHYKDTEATIDNLEYGLMISPIVFGRITCFFRFCAKEERVNIIPISINSLREVLLYCKTFASFSKWLSCALRSLSDNETSAFVETISRSPLSILEQ